MKHQEIREKFLRFFERNGHKIVPSSSLIPDDPSVLLTTAGMQQFKKYYTGEADPIKDFGTKNTVSIQKSFRTSDIDEVGDESHLTFFEMLGNFSFGGYKKKEAIELAHRFLTREMKLEISYVTVFEGNKAIGVPRDEESKAIWKELDPVIEVREQGMDDVFWGPTGSSGPCGPTTEIYVRNGAEQNIEVWNIVFNQYFYPGSREELNRGVSGKKLKELPKFGVDTGMGLERLAMVAQKAHTIFETDLFREPFQYFLAFDAEGRIISDHLRGSIFLIADGIKPSNKGVGYILRRLIRRIVVSCKINNIPLESLDSRINRAVEFYKFYPELGKNEEMILTEIREEIKRFNKTLEKGLNEFFKKYPEMKAQKIEPGKGFKPHILKHVSIDDAFYFHQTFGLTIDIIKDLAKRGGHFVDEEAFNKSLKKHQEVSRAGSEAKFGGHGLYLKTGEVTIRDESEVEKVTRLHTATHLLHAALRAVLGPEVRQDGSDITVERTRFDFRFPRKVTTEELAKIEEWVNAAIQKDLSVEWKETDYESALKDGALGFFREKYPPRVKVYAVFDQKTDEVFSKEFCGGPHVEHTGTIGRFRITKEESSSAGVRRIRAVIE